MKPVKQIVYSNMSFLKEYTLLGELGKGGFAKVYKVRHNDLGYIRAIRVLNEPITDEHSRTYQKFLHECKVLLRLGNGSHRNIVHIYQPRLLDNHALVEMDYVDGQDITHYLKDNGNYLPIEEVMRMVEEMSNALAYCHEDIYQFCMDPDEDDLQNDPIDGSKWLMDEATKKRLIEKYKVIHNDIHSGNIMRRRDGSFVLLDFGLAIEGDEVVKSSSRHENGAPEYMPPEKWDNDTILTEQSDIYSFGVVMYEYLSGRVPFVCEGNSFNARTKLYDKIKNSTSLPSILDLRKSFFEEKHKGEVFKKDYPDWLETAILKCLEKNPTQRFRNGKELHDYVAKHLRAEAITKERVQGLSDEIVSLKDEREKTLAQIADLTKRNDDLAHLADTTTRDLEQARIQLANLHDKQDDRLIRELGELQNSVRQKDDEIQRLRNDIVRLENQAAITGKNSELQKQTESLQTQCRSLEDQLNQTTRDKQRLEEEIGKLKSKSGSKNKPLPIVLCILFGIAAAVMGFLYANKGGDSSIPGDYNMLKTENAELKKTQQDLQSRVIGYDKQVVDLNAEIDRLKKSNQSPSTREKDLQTQLNQANRENAGLEERIIELQNEKKKLQNENTKLQRGLNAANAEIIRLGKK